MRILVVEDEHRIAHTIQKGLTQERYAVDVSYDGVSGYDLASTEEYDVLILDLMLPGMDGMEICRKLRKAGNNVPVLILTAKSLVNDRVSGLDAGADDYLTKPFSFEELLARIRALSRRGRTSLPVKLTAGDLTLDPKEFTVTRAKREIALSAKEFSLLEFLMRNQGKIVTKDQITGHVWNYDADILPNTVEVYIRNLRLKIDEPFPDRKKIIQTVRGFGYRLEG